MACDARVVFEVTETRGTPFVRLQHFGAKSVPPEADFTWVQLNAVEPLVSRNSPVDDADRAEPAI
jgi:hypothetical protein